MRGSRNERRQGLAAALAALLLLASAPPTRAEVGSPIPLIAQAPAEICLLIAFEADAREAERRGGQKFFHL